MRTLKWLRERQPAFGNLSFFANGRETMQHKIWALACAILTMAALVMQMHTAAAQTGTVSLLCIDNQDPGNRIGFDIDYDRKTIVGDVSRGRGRHLTMSQWDNEFIVWGYGSQPSTIDGLLYTLNRRTRVLFQNFLPQNQANILVCDRSRERPL